MQRIVLVQARPLRLLVIAVRMLQVWCVLVCAGLVQMVRKGEPALANLCQDESLWIGCQG